MESWAPGDTTPALFKVSAAGLQLENSRLDPEGYSNAEWNPLGGTYEFSHTGPSFSVTFSGQGFEEPKNEQWCLTHVKITLIRPVVSVGTAGEATFETSPTNPVAGFVVSRTGPTDQSLPVKLGYTGLASMTDHNPLATTVTIPAGQSSRFVQIAAVDDDLEEGDEDRVIHVRPSDRYVVGSTPATVWILDDDGIYDPNNNVQPPKPPEEPPPPPPPPPASRGP